MHIETTSYAEDVHDDFVYISNPFGDLVTITGAVEAKIIMATAPVVFTGRIDAEHVEANSIGFVYRKPGNVHATCLAGGRLVHICRAIVDAETIISEAIVVDGGLVEVERMHTERLILDRGSAIRARKIFANSIEIRAASIIRANQLEAGSIVGHAVDTGELIIRDYVNLS